MEWPPYTPPRAKVSDVGDQADGLAQRILWFYLSPRGRVSRTSFWLLFMLPSLVIALLLFLFVSSTEVEALEWAAWAVFAWPNIAVQAKRWHDINLSGWWILANLIPFVGTLGALIANGFVRGTNGPNRFGDDPLATSPAG